MALLEQKRFIVFVYWKILKIIPLLIRNWKQLELSCWWSREKNENELEYTEFIIKDSFTELIIKDFLMCLVLYLGIGMSSSSILFLVFTKELKSK